MPRCRSLQESDYETVTLKDFWMLRMRSSIALLLFSFACLALSPAQDGSASGSKRIEGVNRSVDTYSRDVNVAVKPSISSADNAVKPRSPKSASSWGPSANTPAADDHSAAQSPFVNNSPGQTPGLDSRAAVAEKAKGAYGSMAPDAAARTRVQAGSAIPGNSSSRNAPAKLGRSGAAANSSAASLQAPSPRPSAGVPNPTAGGAPSFADGLERHSLGSSSTSALSGGGGLRRSARISAKKTREKSTRGLLSSGAGARNLPTAARNAKNPRNNGAQSPTYGAKTTNDRAIFHGEQK